MSKTSRRDRGSVLSKTIPGVVAVIVVLALWQFATAVSQSIYFPTPLTIARKIGDMWFTSISDGFFSAKFYTDVTPSISRLVIGLVIAIVMGVILGTLLGVNRIIAELIEPVLHFMRALPGPVLIPLALVLAGPTTTMRVGIIVVGSIWPVLFNTYNAVSRVPEDFHDVARMCRMGPLKRFSRVTLPACGPEIFAGVRTATALGIILLIAAELVASVDGLGFGLTQAQRSFQFVVMWAFITALSILGFVANAILAGIGRVLLRWHFLRREGTA